eukprot:snap_masked-scaffold_19-processed-gene-5.4-mRNA-1 protein AED:1.00 eAED:1.00 QI:0/-1/0/0/-1/1/1/0/107
MVFENTYAADHLLHEGYPPGVRYTWSDNENEPDKVLPVNKYLEKVLEWIGKEMEDPTLFPQEEEDEAPQSLDIESIKFLLECFMFLLFFVVTQFLFKEERMCKFLEL